MVYYQSLYRGFQIIDYMAIEHYCICTNVDRCCYLTLQPKVSEHLPTLPLGQYLSFKCSVVKETSSIYCQIIQKTSKRDAWFWYHLGDGPVDMPVRESFDYIN